MIDGNRLRTGTIESSVNRRTKFVRLQIINIMKGEMSFVGPRPSLYDHMKFYTERQKDRFLMKPGITGLAQINGRNTLKWSKRIEYDIDYIENYSLWLDLLILIKTIKVAILRQGIVLDRNPEDVYDLKIQLSSKIRLDSF